METMTSLNVLHSLGARGKRLARKRYREEKTSIGGHCCIFGRRGEATRNWLVANIARLLLEYGMTVSITYDDYKIGLMAGYLIRYGFANTELDLCLLIYYGVRSW